MLVTLLQRGVDLVLFGGCVLAALSVGAASVRRLAPFGISRLEAVTLALGAGIVVIAYGVLVIGLLGWLHRAVLIGWLAVCYAVGLRDALQELGRRRFPYPFAERWRDLHWTERVLAVLTVVLNLLALLLCFVPPWAGEWDSLSYHLAVPKLYWLDGRVHYLPFTHHAQFPMTPQMLYLLGLGLTELKSAAVAKSFHWLCFVLCQLALLSWGAGLPHRSLRMGLFAAVAFATMPLAFTEATTAYVDVALTAFVLLHLLGLTRFLQQPDGRWLLWSGLFAGAAAGTKYTGLLCVAVVVAAPAVLWLMRRPLAGQWRAVLAATLLAFGVAAPWYIKNWLWTGNPVFPFAYGLFGGRQWSAEMAQAYTLSNREFGGGRDIGALLALPFNLTLNEIRFGRCAGQWLGNCFQKGTCPKRWKCGKFDNVDTPPLSVGILPLAISPTAVLLVPWATVSFSVGVGLPVAVAVAWLAWGFAEAQYLRYLLPVLAVGCLVVGVTVAAWVRINAVMATLVRSVVAAGVVYASLVIMWYAKPLLPVAVGVEEPESFLRATTPVYRVAEFVNRALPHDAVIATYGEPLGYYFERRYFWADDGHNRLVPYARLKRVDDLIVAWRRLGVTHIIVNWRYVPAESVIARWIADGKRRGLLETLWRDDAALPSTEVLAVVRRRGL
ncbi:hypothetical protein HRbin17_01938 [bacterium HR17]|uniref:Glycosyltransferase RgtA/B/C/D-like domain-containing protein n=1 Tax=Candidatus Fervidibacter japonicus TaxID=2035412 RepID=A0A2H5XE16_9BACT|nr:hypothetical protein HRbin17_01938 [bacterium HR17]